RQVLFARGVTERAPDRHRPLAWPLDSALGVEADFASHFPRTLLVWIGSVHALHLAIAACRRKPASTAIRNEPVEDGVLLVVVAPCQLFLAVKAGARPDHPIGGLVLAFGTTPVLNLRSAREDPAHRHRTGV